MIVTKEGYVYRFDSKGNDIIHQDQPEFQALLDKLYPRRNLAIEIICDMNGDYVFRVFRKSRTPKRFDFLMKREEGGFDKAVAIGKMIDTVNKNLRRSVPKEMKFRVNLK